MINILDIPRIYYPDPQIKDDNKDKFHLVTDYSKNFNQLYSSLEFVNVKENFDNLVEIIKKIKKGVGKPILDLNKVECVLKTIGKI
uniref:Uncharacterized protein n=1 Tax=Meloidogyne enterolobii TaxID=390850 RepID=A0A6V7VG26_MELEN|nr:unnamed protein product [Meloidogyne enterolobii]